MAHKRKRTYTCKYCDKMFTQSWTAEYHERTHTGGKPYICNHCGYKFSQAGSKNRHVRRAHSSAVQAHTRENTSKKV